MNRKPKRKDFVGKTIESINTAACNVWTFKFTDGTQVQIEAELIPMAYGDYLAGMTIVENP